MLDFHFPSNPPSISLCTPYPSATMFLTPRLSHLTRLPLVKSRTRTLLIRTLSTSKDSPKEPLVVTSTSPTGVTTIRMNNPKKLNGWTEKMLLSLFSAFQTAATDSSTKAVIITGTGKYYCAGVDLSGTIKPMHPSELHNMIYTSNKKVFDTFLEFPKPLVAAVNGPAIGASVTTSTLCDYVVASEVRSISRDLKLSSKCRR